MKYYVPSPLLGPVRGRNHSVTLALLCCVIKILSLHDKMDRAPALKKGFGFKFYLFVVQFRQLSLSESQFLHLFNGDDNNSTNSSS